jgi:hypothetical protein
MAKKQTTAELFALRALYCETAALLETMAKRFDKVASGATMAAQLRDLAVDVRVECSIREHPTSSEWPALKWGECAALPASSTCSSARAVSAPGRRPRRDDAAAFLHSERRPISARACEAAERGFAEDAGALIGQREKRGDRQ